MIGSHAHIVTQTLADTGHMVMAKSKCSVNGLTGMQHSTMYQGCTMCSCGFLDDIDAPTRISRKLFKDQFMKDQPVKPNTVHFHKLPALVMKRAG